MAKKGKRKPRQKTTKQAKIFSEAKLGHATHVTGNVWNVWFHIDPTKGHSRLVGDRVTRAVALKILEEIDNTGGKYGQAKGEGV